MWQNTCIKLSFLIWRPLPNSPNCKKTMVERLYEQCRYCPNIILDQHILSILYVSYIQKSIFHSIRLTPIAEISNVNSLTNTGLIDVGHIVVKLWRRL